MAVKSVLAVLVMIMLVFVPQAWAYGEADANGRPVWHDRANHVLVNAVRMSPAGYESVYMSGWDTVNTFGTTTYGATYPLYISPQLDSSAYNHSLDLALTNTFSHSSSDGTGPFDRIKLFYTCSGWLGENIAAGYSNPLDANNQWLCDGNKTVCAKDGVNDGHRSNIMSKNYKVIGIGYAARSGSRYTHYWTQDFGGAACTPAPTNPIYGGSHIFPSAGNIKFMATFYLTTSATPTSAKVYVDGTAKDLTYEIGLAAGQGHYVNTQTAASACRNYYFEFVSGGVTYRYPDTGFLVTYQEGSCVTSFTTGSASTAAPSTAAPTTAAPTTAAPTTATPTTDAPTTVAPTTAAPTTAAPTTDAPTTAAPTTATPTTAAPTTAAPTTTAPTTAAPTTAAPTTTTSTRAPTTTTTTTRAPTTTTKAPTTTTKAPTTTASGSTFSSDILTNHNQARSVVGQRGLVWNDTIATFATNYAKTCVWKHNPNNNLYGENIYASSGAVPSTIGVKASASWIGEKADYNCAANTCTSGKVCGHYTQVIWGSTTQVGCGAVTCTQNSPWGSTYPTWTFVVCDYAAPGNYVGQRPVPTTSCA